VGFLVVVQVTGGTISQPAGIMVAPLRDPHGDFGWGIGTIGVLMAVYYVVGALFSPVSSWLGERYGAWCSTIAAMHHYYRARTARSRTGPLRLYSEWGKMGKRLSLPM
jgi:MFS family permease